MRVSSIKRKNPRTLQSLILYGLTLLIALGLKYHYSRSGSEDLLWILAPTAGLVECISGTRFINEVNTGYVNYERRVIIAPSCSGINFMIIVFCMTAFSGLNTLTRVRMNYPIASSGVSSRHSGEPKGHFRNLDSRFRGNDRNAPSSGVLNPGSAIRSLWPMISLIIAYGLTLGVNTFRIITSMVVYDLEFIWNWASMDQIHRIQGILIYFISLYIFYLILQRVLDMFQYHPKERKTDTDFSMNYFVAPINRDLRFDKVRTGRFAPTSSGVSSRHSGKPEGLIRNLDSRFRGNDRNAASSGVLDPGFAIKQVMDVLKGLIPLFWYCAVTIGIPLFGRAYLEQGNAFFQHSIVVLSVCLLTFMMFSIVRLSCQYLFYKISYRKNMGSKDGSS